MVLRRPSLGSNYISCQNVPVHGGRSVTIAKDRLEMSDNSRITTILAVAMTLAVVLSVLLFVYLFYRAQTRRLQDVEILPKSYQG